MPTIINPNRPVSLQDFASIYSSAATPQDAARDLFFNAPQSGQSYLEDQWSRLGIKGSPEDYFSNPANVAALTAGRGQSIPPSVAPAQQWPSFNNEAERNLAVDSGAYDPQYPNPRAMQVAQEQEKIDQANYYKNAALAAQTAPINPQYDSTGRLSNPSDVLRGQLAGDSKGDITTVLRSVQGDPMDRIIPPMIRRPLDPYLPEAGYGGPQTTNTSGAIDKLDRTVYHNPKFQKILADDPKRAEFVYQRLVGRSMGEDVNSAVALQKDQKETGFNFAKDALANRQATFNPNTKTWRLLSRVPPPEGGLSSLSNPGATAQMVDATPVQNQWLNEHYSNVLGGRLPHSEYNPQSTQNVLARELQDPLVAKEISDHEKILGRPLTVGEKLGAAKNIALKRAEAGGHGPWMNTLLQYGNAILGVKNVEGQDPSDVLRAAYGDSQPPETLNDATPYPPPDAKANQQMPDDKMNWWGNFIRDALHRQESMKPMVGGGFGG